LHKRPRPEGQRSKSFLQGAAEVLDGLADLAPDATDGILCPSGNFVFNQIVLFRTLLRTV
jgi:hypothetical protein